MLVEIGGPIARRLASRGGLLAVASPGFPARAALKHAADLLHSLLGFIS